MFFFRDSLNLEEAHDLRFHTANIGLTKKNNDGVPDLTDVPQHKWVKWNLKKGVL